MYELEFIGRGGQGAKTAAEIIARSAMKKGSYIQSFPDYGPERKGAPVRAFTRISNSQIRGCSSEANPDVIIILDPTLVSLSGTFFNPREGQLMVINTSEDAAALKATLKSDVHTIDATRIALEVLGSPITNTAMLGALAKITGMITLDELKKEIADEFAKKLDEDMLKKNMILLERAYNEAK